MKPLRCASALAVTIAVFYSLCFLVEVLFPEQFMRFMNALFHGLDFGMLAKPESPDVPGFFSALAVLLVWGFAVGAFFAWLFNILGARDTA